MVSSSSMASVCALQAHMKFIAMQAMAPILRRSPNPRDLLAVVLLMAAPSGLRPHAFQKRRGRAIGNLGGAFSGQAQASRGC
jgi:hypothetical protein